MRFLKSDICQLKYNRNDTVFFKNEPGTDNVS